MPEAIVQIQVTSASGAELERIIESLLQRRLIACGQLAGEVTSRYWWKGALETARERTCLLKTTAAASGAVVAAVREMHSYETPEILVIPVAGGDAGYLAWIREVVEVDPPR